MDNQLIKYLENIVNLEKSVYTQSQTISELENHIQNLAIPVAYDKPSRPSEYCPNWLSGTWTGICIGAFLGGIMGIFCGNFFSSIVLGAALFFILVIGFHAYDASSENSARDARYNQEKESYNIAIALDHMRVEEEEQQKEKLSEDLQMMQIELASTKDLLSQYYSQNIIFPKYRNLIAMCSIYEYFISGRCTQLAGHEGAYNKYEDEVRMERIYTELEKVVNKLEEIKNNQYVLYDAIQEGNRLSQKLIDETVHNSQLTERLIDRTEVNNYYQEKNYNEANQIKWLMLYDSVNKQQN